MSIYGSERLERRCEKDDDGYLVIMIIRNRIVSKSPPVYIYHITHVDNLPSIIADGYLWSDSRVSTDDTERVVIGYDHIKERRLSELPVRCHPNTMVGEYVPFYFCPRSPMLFKISRRDSSLIFTEGQRDIVHLVSTVKRAIETAAGRQWAFSDGNAGAFYTQFSKNIDEIQTFVDWNAVNRRWWSGSGIDPNVQSKKMAEFLIFEKFPWSAFGAIGVMGLSVAEKVKAGLNRADHQPKIIVKPDWYY